MSQRTDSIEDIDQKFSVSRRIPESIEQASPLYCSRQYNLFLVTFHH